MWKLTKILRAESYLTTPTTVQVSVSISQSSVDSRHLQEIDATLSLSLGYIRMRQEDEVLDRLLLREPSSRSTSTSRISNLTSTERKFEVSPGD